MRMFARTLVVAAVLVGVLAACNSDALPPVGQHGTITGTVLDRATNAPIAGAHITVDAILVAVSGDDGKFTIENVPSGDFDFTVEAKGYASFTGSAKTESDKPFALSLTMEKATSP
ncbi:MAG: carboxypeptidase-like regulatory domain-containing protein [Candidatus Eremiobacteraeota bacterium]|nr:carboxypeptidase-like regulatory domain-containing protein [Candidatus Eremiobacteraeota bacterium]